MLEASNDMSRGSYGSSNLLRVLLSVSTLQLTALHPAPAREPVMEELAARASRTGHIANGQDAISKSPQGPEVLDTLISALMSKWNLPGGAVAITKYERLVFARGYGVADKESGELVRPDSLFRIGSVSKSITAVAILKLVEDGKLDLDGKAFQLLDQLKPPPGTDCDPRLQQVTIRQLLYHSGGWDSRKSPDPTGRFREAAGALKVPLPVAAEALIRYAMGLPLDFDPGTEHAYVNFGYCILGRVVEKVSGQTYEDYVCDHLLKPLGITRMKIGRTLPGERAPGEVCYYPAPGVSPVTSALSDDGKVLPLPYGGYSLESMDSYGGWIASVVDLARFLAAVDGRDYRPDLLKPETLHLMTERPSPPLWVGTPTYYAMGWNVRPLKSGNVLSHTGALAGTSLAVIVCTPKGLSWAAVFNSIPAKVSEINPFFVDLDRAIGQGMDRVEEWPGDDLFEKYR